MTKKKENNASKLSFSNSKKEADEQRLLDAHPYETMSQIQNRYGDGRKKNGSEGSEKDAQRLNH